MKNVIWVLIMGLCSFNALAFDTDIGGTVNAYAMQEFDADGDGAADWVGIFLTESTPTVTECDVAYVGEDMLWLKLDGSQLSESMYGAVVSASATGLDLLANYTVDGDTDLCIVDALLVAIP